MRKTLIVLAFATALALAGTAAAQSTETLVLETPALALANIPFEVSASGLSPGAEAVMETGAGSVRAQAGDDGVVTFTTVRLAGSGTLRLVVDGAELAVADVRVVPGWLSVVPPVLAIAIALLFQQVIPALFLGVWVGAAFLYGFGPTAWLYGLLDSFNVYVQAALVDPVHAPIILFSLMIGGMVGIVIKNGGMQGVVGHIVKFATDPKRGQITTGALGLVIFFDDYANTLVVGNTMRQVTDRLRISREKLAYLVDSTAAPVSCVALVTTWIGYEVGLIGSAIENIDGLDMSPYSVFLNQIPYSFYPLLTMFFVFVVASSGRDFGPMLGAERRARATGEVVGPDAVIDPAARADSEEMKLPEDCPVRAINAVIPVLTLIGTVLVGLLVTGSGDTLQDIIANSDSYIALMWGSLMGVVVAAVMTLVQRILTAQEIVEAWYSGLKSMMFAMIILVLAWALAGVSEQLHTADYLVSVLSDSLIPGTVPAIVFVLAAATAFATGSSWATMGILMPLVVPLVWAVISSSPAGLPILYSAVACVLAGSVLGDHCSPISDTTILSSMASGCDHIAHVRTQLPYALTVGGVALLLGTLPAGFGVPWWVGLVAGGAALLAISRWLGKPVEE